ncbi:hypothetical protein JXB11_01430 [Candidatus Woesearchaeota archaeon]|nr:hypothetical protein [Candidatus Woesearchaeota archaeon]
MDKLEARLKDFYRRFERLEKKAGSVNLPEEFYLGMKAVTGARALLSVLDSQKVIPEFRAEIPLIEAQQAGLLDTIYSNSTMTYLESCTGQN